MPQMLRMVLNRNTKHSKSKQTNKSKEGNWHCSFRDAHKHNTYRIGV